MVVVNRCALVVMYKLDYVGFKELSLFTGAIIPYI